METYRKENRGIQIIRLENSYQMCTSESCYDSLIRIAARPRKPVLTDVVMETLSIIAYRQPVTRGEIEEIRGVSCDSSVNTLLDRGLIQEEGRKDVPGRPALFGTTMDFLKYFGLTSIKDLPELTLDEADMGEEKEGS